jgi:hypothetical protein
MTESQHRFFNSLVQSASDSRANLHEVAWILLGVVLLAALIVLTVAGIWILNGGLSAYYRPNSPAGRKEIEDWLREPVSKPW